MNRSGRSLQPAIFHQHTPQAVLGGIIVAGPRIAMVVLPDLVLVGLARALSLNDGASRRWSPLVTEAATNP